MTDTERGKEKEMEPATPNQNEGEEWQQDWEAVIREAKAAGVVEKPQQVLTSPPRTPRYASLHVLGLPMEAAVEVHVEEANLDAI